MEECKRNWLPGGIFWRFWRTFDQTLTLQSRVILEFCCFMESQVSLLMLRHPRILKTAFFVILVWSHSAKICRFVFKGYLEIDKMTRRWPFWTKMAEVESLFGHGFRWLFASFLMVVGPIKLHVVAVRNKRWRLTFQNNSGGHYWDNLFPAKQTFFQFGTTTYPPSPFCCLAWLLFTCVRQVKSERMGWLKLRSAPLSMNLRRRVIISYFFYSLFFFFFFTQAWGRMGEWWGGGCVNSSKQADTNDRM